MISPRLLFKKIDSTLRGHAGVEIAAALDAFKCDAAVVCPAFPAMNRIVSAGQLHINGGSDFEPIDVAAHIRGQGIEQCTYAQCEEIAIAISSGVRVIVLDAVCDADLYRIVAEGLATGLRLLWTGSGGLSAALARKLQPGLQCHSLAVPAGPLLFCLGSNHAVTVAQETALLNRMQTPLVHAEQTTIGTIDAELRQGRHVVLRIPRGAAGKERLMDLLPRERISAFLVSGGDTATLFCEAAGVRYIELVDEVLPGIPHGIIRGGAFDGTSIVTKSGGFGAPDALIQIAEYFS